MRYIILIMTISLLSACGGEPFPRYWYPIQKTSVVCGNPAYEVTVYKLKHTRAWRSWPYYIDTTTKQEISFGQGTSCIYTILETYGELTPDDVRAGNLHPTQAFNRIYDKEE